MPSFPTPVGTEAAERVADVLLSFAQGGDTMGVSEIARQLNLSKAVVHRILQSLVSRDLVQFNAMNRVYSLGPSATLLGAKALRNLNLRDAARDELASLRDESRETTTLSLLVGDKRTYVDQFESPQEIKMMVELGRLYPLYAGASSRAILAYLPSDTVDRIIDAGLAPLTSETILDPEALVGELEQVRTAGYAISRGERQSGAGSVAAPLFGMDHAVVGSISLCGPVSRFEPDTVERFIPLVTAAAARISAQLVAPTN